MTTLAAFVELPADDHDPEYTVDPRDRQTLTTVLDEYGRPHEDVVALYHYRRGRDYSLEEIADALGTNREAVRLQLVKFGLNEPTLAQKLTEMNPEDLGLSPSTGETDSKYNRRAKA